MVVGQVVALVIVRVRSNNQPVRSCFKVSSDDVSGGSCLGLTAHTTNSHAMGRVCAGRWRGGGQGWHGRFGDQECCRDAETGQVLAGDDIVQRDEEMIVTELGGSRECLSALAFGIWQAGSVVAEGVVQAVRRSGGACCCGGML